MPFVSVKTTADEWSREANRLATIIQRGPGSPHQRVETLKQALLSTAAENFNAGKAEGASAATPVSMLGELEHLRAEVTQLKAKPKVVQELPVTDADLMEAMRLADEIIKESSPTDPITGQAERVQKLAMEVAKLRYQAKAAAK